MPDIQTAYSDGANVPIASPMNLMLGTSILYNHGICVGKIRASCKRSMVERKEGLKAFLHGRGKGMNLRWPIMLTMTDPQLCMACINCESTSSAMVIMSGSTWLKSTVGTLFCKV